MTVRASDSPARQSADSTWVPVQGVLWRETGDGLLLLPPGKTRTLSLNVSAAWVWRSLGEFPRIDDAARWLSQLSGVDQTRVRTDVAMLLEELERRGVVRCLGR